MAKHTKHQSRGSANHVKEWNKKVWFWLPRSVGAYNVPVPRLWCSYNYIIQLSPYP